MLCEDRWIHRGFLPFHFSLRGREMELLSKSFTSPTSQEFWCPKFVPKFEFRRCKIPCAKIYSWRPHGSIDNRDWRKSWQAEMWQDSTLFSPPAHRAILSRFSQKTAGNRRHNWFAIVSYHIVSKRYRGPIRRYRWLQNGYISNSKTLKSGSVSASVTVINSQTIKVGICNPETVKLQTWLQTCRN